MSMVVRNNLSAINTLNTLNKNHSALAKSLQTVSSGMRINGAKDDASGYAISERMRVQIRSLNQDNRNTQNGHSMMKVAEGAVQSTVDILKTLKEKVINAANDTNTDSDRQQIQKELDQSIDQINDNANVTYNGKYLVDGSKNGKSDGTFTALTNSSLSKTTNGGILLTALKDRNEQDLNIQSSDSVTVSYVQQGKTYTTTFQVGNNTLQDIFKKAEDIDSSSQTFADRSNPSVGLASGAPDLATLQAQQQQLANNLDSARRALNSANNAVSAQESIITATESSIQALEGIVSGLQTQKAAIRTKLTTLDNTVANNTQNGTFLHNGHSYTLYAADIQNSYNQWNPSNSSLTESSALSSYPKTSDATASSTYSDFYYAAVEPTTAISTIKNDFDAYGTAYSTFTSASYTVQYGTTSGATIGSVGTGDTALSYANADLTDARSALSSEQTTLGNLRSTAQIAQQNFDRAYGDYSSQFGPYLLHDENVGLDYAGQIQKTPDLGSALTITAHGRGIDGQIAGFTISVTDTNGNIKKSVNAVLDAWTETIRAENASPEDNALVLQTGTRANQAIKVRLSDMRAQALGLQGKDGTTLNVSNQKNANAAINVLDNAIQKALDQQTAIGAIESRLEYTSTNLTTAAENVTASESTIRDADMAQAMTQYTKNNILMQASQAMLAQANQNNNQVLSLLR